MKILEAKKISYHIKQMKILDNISIFVNAGERVGVLGENGSGKSILLKTIYRSIKPQSGEILFQNKDIHDMSYLEIAKNISIMAQETETQFAFTVREIVLMGRLPHKKIFNRFNDEDHEIVNNSLNLVDAVKLSERKFQTLSGGEKQRVLLARAIAQQPKFLILDEPTNHLDIYFQIEILKLVKALNITTLAVLHDINLANYFCDRIYLIKNGRIFFEGLNNELMDSNIIKSVYGVESHIVNSQTDGKNYVIFPVLQ